jgi:drug/metabolite transporter (DMT)-like permease
MSSAEYFSKRPELLPSLCVAVSGIFWGLFWIVLRAFEDNGFEGAWPGLVVYCVCFVFLLPFLPYHWNRIRRNAATIFVTGLFTGTAFALYAASLIMTEVVRTLLLFYLTPIWSTLLGIFLLGERVTSGRVAALVLGFAGLLVVLGLGEGLPWPRNLGDWLGLAAGMFWSYGTLKAFQDRTIAAYDLILVFALGGAIVLGICIFIGANVFGSPPSLAEARSALPLMLFAGIYTLPMLYLTIWPVRLISPARVGILLMGEVVVGVGSAAWLSGEPFGMREVVGTLLILSAAAVEVSDYSPVMGKSRRDEP